MTPAEFAQKILWLGHNTDGTSDKIWGCLQLAPAAPVLTFWGKRSGPWKFKPLSEYSGGTTYYEKSEEKRREGYCLISPARLGGGFAAELQLTLSRTVLRDSFHNHPGA